MNINIHVNQPLVHFLQQHGRPLIHHFAGNLFVLTDVGERILHGIISCLVRAHKGFLSYNGELTLQNLWVAGYQGTTAIIPETASVYIRQGAVLSHPLNVENQLADYTSLSLIICKIVPETRRPRQQVNTIASVERLDTIVWLLDREELLSLEGQHRVTDESLILKSRNQLLEALAAMTDPLVMATMWWNLVGFQKSLEGPGMPPHYYLAFRLALQRTNQINWCQYIDWHPNFKGVFDFKNKQWKYRNQDNGEGLLRFARNWFTHAPGLVLTAQVRDLDYIFSITFPYFMGRLLQQLYLFYDLSTFLVPRSSSFVPMYDI